MRSASTGSTNTSTHSVSPGQQGGTGRRFSTRKSTKALRPIKIVKDLTFNSNCTSCLAAEANLCGIDCQGGKMAPSLLTATENNSRAASCNCSSRSKHLYVSNSPCDNGQSARSGARRARRQKKLRVAGFTAAVDTMGCCAQNTAEQAKCMHIKGTDCKLDNPYSGLRTETFKKLLKSSGSRAGARGRRAKPGKSTKKRIKWCKPNVDECDGMRLQLCPHLGKGHTHEKLIEEVTPVLLRAALNVNCQLREVCRRLFFMKQNVPQLTAPVLVNFHAILNEITGMLIADFTSFPTGLKLPDSGSPTSRSPTS